MSLPTVDPNRHVGRVFEETVAKFPDREALVFYGSRATFREWEDKANSLSVQFEGLGVEKGDRIALLLPTCVEIPYVFMALAKLGAVTVPVNPMLQAGEIEFQLQDVGAKVVVTIAEFMKRDFLSMIEEMRPRLPQLRHVIVKGPAREGTLSLEAMLAAEKPAPRATFVKEGLGPDDLLNIFFTGGTTGLPKGVMSDSYQLLYPDALRRKDMTENDVMLLVPPFFMTSGFITLALPILYGTKLVGMPAFDPRAILQLIQDEKITYMFAYPTMMRWILALPTFDQYDVSSMRLVGIGGEPVTTEMIQTIQRRLGCLTSTGYGMTESRAVCTTPMDATPELISGSDGQPYPDIEVMIVDAQGRPVPMGEVGEVIIRGRPVFKGYWNRPEVNAQVFDQEGFWHTGDMARQINAEGYIRFVGRAKDTIRRGAMTIYPEEVENLLRTHPRVANAGVIGVPSPVAGERVRAYVQLHPNQQMTAIEVVDYCRDKLAAYKLPDEVRFIPEVPLSPVRRVQRWKLREAAAKEAQS